MAARGRAWPGVLGVYRALTNPGLGTSVAARGAEWFRGHGGSGIVNWAENLWYSHHPPPVGGKPAQSPSRAGPAATSGPVRAAIAHLPAPLRLTSPAGPELAGEGVWHPAGRPVDGLPAVYETWVRPDAVHTSLVVGVAWMDTKLLTATLYSGSTIPGGGPYQAHRPGLPGRGQDPRGRVQRRLPDDQRQRRLLHRRPTVLPLRNGAASFVIYRDGTAGIAAGITAPP